MKSVSLKIITTGLQVVVFWACGHVYACAQVQLNRNDIPPEVLHALYPNQAETSTANETQSIPTYFETSIPETEFGVGSSDSREAQARFNDSVFDRLISDQELRAAQTQVPRQLPRNPPNQTATEPNDQRQPVDPVVQTATCIGSMNDAAFHRVPQPTDLRTPANLIDPELFNPIPQKETVAMAESAAPKTMTLAEMLEESNRGIRRDQDTVPPEVDRRSLEMERKTTSKHSIGENFASSPGFAKTIQQIATSLCLVLVIGVGFILIAKQVYRRTTNAPARPLKCEKQSESLSIQVASTIRLDSKSTLHLVDVVGERVLVATDLSGIKSVVALSRPFDALLNEAVDRADNESEQSSEITDAGTYSPAMRQSSSQHPSTHHRSKEAGEHRSSEEVEAEMRKQLAELLGGQAFKDVFLKQVGRVA